jgi:hypothetical protein
MEGERWKSRWGEDEKKNENKMLNPISAAESDSIYGKVKKQVKLLLCLTN